MTRRARAVAGHLKVRGTWLDARGRRPFAWREIDGLVKHGVTGIVFTVQGFERAMDGDRTEAIEALALRGLRDPKVIYERASVEEVRVAASALEAIHEHTAGRDGYAALELSPGGYDAGTAIEEGRRLFRLVARRNVMIQIPAIVAGTTALAQWVADGIGVSIALVGTPLAYETVARAHLRGVERFLAVSRSGRRVPSVVASIPVSRLDRAANRSIDALLANQTYRLGDGVVERLKRARGRVGASIAALASARRREFESSEEWAAMASLSVEPPRIVWAADGSAVAETVDDAWTSLGALVEAEISPAELGDRILAEEVTAATRSFESLLARVARARDRALGRLRHARRHPFPAHDAEGVASRGGVRAPVRRGG